MGKQKLQLPSKPNYLKFAEDIDFFGLFQKINQHFETCFLLESLGPEGELARYSIIGFDPEMILSAQGQTLKINQKTSTVANPYDALKKITPQNIIARAYGGGLVGYLGYDAINYFEPTLKIKTHPRFPQFLFGVYTDGLILDKMTGAISYFYYKNDRSALINKIQKLEIENWKLKIKSLGDTITKKQHAKMVTAVKDEIRAGNTFQCVIGFKTEYQIQGEPLKIYERLRKINPSPHMYFLKFGAKKIIGASPELLFRVRERELETFPLAGTAARGKTAAEDQKLARELLNNPKEIAEHNMLVDLHRNDLGRVSRFGTVKVRRLCDIKRFSHVQHISSEITGIMAPGEDMFSALASNFPAGTLSGAPKFESMKIIDRLENAPRGPYGGAVGHFGFNGNCTFTIPIRSFFVSGSYGYTQNASGIVHDSSPEQEYEEVKRKGEAMNKVLNE